MSSVYDDSHGSDRLEPAGRLPGAELLVARDSAAAAHAHFKERAAFGTELRRSGFSAPIRSVLTFRVPLGVRKDFQTLRWDRLAADLAEPCLLPVAAVLGRRQDDGAIWTAIIRSDDGKTRAVTRIAGKPVSIHSQELAHQLGWRMRRSP